MIKTVQNAAFRSGNLFKNHEIGQEQAIVRERQNVEKRYIRIRIAALVNHQPVEIAVRAVVGIHNVVWNNRHVAWVEQYPVIRLVAVGVTALIAQLITCSARVAHITFPECPAAVEQRSLCVRAAGRTGQLVVVGGSAGEIHRYRHAAAQGNGGRRHDAEVVAVFYDHIVTTCCGADKNNR